MARRFSNEQCVIGTSYVRRHAKESQEGILKQNLRERSTEGQVAIFTKRGQRYATCTLYAFILIFR